MWNLLTLCVIKTGARGWKGFRDEGRKGRWAPHFVSTVSKVIAVSLMTDWEFSVGRSRGFVFRAPSWVACYHPVLPVSVVRLDMVALAAGVVWTAPGAGSSQVWLCLSLSQSGWAGLVLTPLWSPPSQDCVCDGWWPWLWWLESL